MSTFTSGKDNIKKEEKLFERFWLQWKSEVVINKSVQI